MKEFRYRQRGAVEDPHIAAGQLQSVVESSKSSSSLPDTSKYRKKSPQSSCWRLALFVALCLAAHSVFTARLTTRLSVFSQAVNKLRPSSTVIPLKPNTTLALLYPPGLLGGYRNQVIRLMGWVSYAVTHNYSYLYLPSVLWSTQMQQFSKQPWYPIPMELIFDVDYWNRDEFDNFLPKLVKTIGNSDCWVGVGGRELLALNWTSLHPIQQASLQQGFLSPIANITQKAMSGTLQINTRRVSFLEQVQHCQHPVVYGGGKSAGVLWNDYLMYRSSKSTDKRLPKDIDHYILRVLRPAERWISVANECITAAKHGANYMALHARVEVEMMAHNCGAEMNWNLTSIFQQVAVFLSKHKKENIGGVFVAVSRDGMHANVSEGPWQKYKPYADANIVTLDRLVGDGGGQKGEGLLDGQVTVFECGKRMMDKFYASHPQEPYYGSLLEQVINFHIAVSAKVFVGVKHSSYSTDVWTTRFRMGLGAYNFRYTRDGNIEPVENGGLPEPHANCATRRTRIDGK